MVETKYRLTVSPEDNYAAIPALMPADDSKPTVRIHAPRTSTRDILDMFEFEKTPVLNNDVPDDRMPLIPTIKPPPKLESPAPKHQPESKEKAIFEKPAPKLQRPVPRTRPMVKKPTESPKPEKNVEAKIEAAIPQHQGPIA